MMPRMNGYQFVTELHKHDDWRSIPIIVVTARDMSTEERIALDGYVEKVLPKHALTEDALLTERQDLTTDCGKAKHPAQKKQSIYLRRRNGNHPLSIIVLVADKKMNRVMPTR